MTDTMTMSYTLDQLAADIRSALKADPGRAGKLAVGHHVERALKDKDFVATHLKTARQGRRSARGALRGRRARLLHLRPRL